MKKIFSLLAIWLGVTSVLAQGTLQGVITMENSEPLPGASIQLEDNGTATTTDKFGAYRLTGITAGSYNLRISFIGFESQTVPIEISDGQTIKINATLKPSAIELSDITVSGGLDRSVNTLSQVDINLRPVNTSQDVLRMVPGLFIAQHAGGGKAEQIFIRGFDADHGTDINIEVDGMPVNMVSHAHGQGYADLHFLIPELINYVDFDKGPYFANKGDFTTAGYVEFQTKNKLDQNFAKVEGGSFGTARVVAGVNFLNTAKSSAYIASEFHRTDGFFDLSQHFTRFNVQTKFNTRLSERSQLTFGATAFDSKWDASGQIPDRAVESGMISRYGSIDPSEGGNTGRFNFYLKTNHGLRNGATLENEAYAFNYHFSLYSNFTFYLNDGVNGDEIHQEENRWVYGYKTQYSQTSSLGGMRLQTELGTGIRYDAINDIALSHAVKRQFISDFKRGDIRQANLNAYWSETLWLASNFSVNAALRYDYLHFDYTDKLEAEQPTPQGKGIVSPKLNFTWEASKQVNLFVRTGTGFHSNDTRVVVAQQAREILPRAFGIDVGTDIKVTPTLLVHAALWRLDLDQEFVYVGDEAVVEPSGKTQREGIDLSVRYQINSWLFADADLNVTRPRAKGVPDGEDRIPLAPTTTSIGGLTFRKREGFNGSLRYRYLGDRAANETNTVVASGYFICDMLVNYSKPGYEIGASVENLFNTEWKEAQFDTESRLMNEADPVSEIHFTPGTPFAFKIRFTKYF